MLGTVPGWPISQGEILGLRLARDGHLVATASTRPGRVGRLLDMICTVLKHRRSTDVLVLQVYSGLSFVVEDIVSLIASTLGIPVVMHLHGGGFPEFAARHRAWSSRVLGRGSVRVAPSRFLARVANGLDLTCRVIPNIIDPGEYAFRERRHVRPRLFWMRTFHPIYEPEMAVRVLARVREWAPDSTLVMAGAKGPVEASIRRMARKLGLDEAVRFPGYLDLPGKNREGGNADIFLNTNQVDNTPVSVIEACAMGLPVVTTDVGGIRDLLSHGETGLLVERGNDAEMADAVGRLCRDPELVSGLSRRGRALSQRFSWTVAAEAWDDALRAALSTADKGTRRVA